MPPMWIVIGPMRMAMPAPLCRAWLAGAGQCALPDRIADDRYHARSIGRPPEPPPSTLYVIWTSQTTLTMSMMFDADERHDTGYSIGLDNIDNIRICTH